GKIKNFASSIKFLNVRAQRRDSCLLTMSGHRPGRERGDRFIATRSNINANLAYSALVDNLTSMGKHAVDTSSNELRDPAKLSFQAALHEALFDTSEIDARRVLSFAPTRQAPKRQFDNKLCVLYAVNRYNAPAFVGSEPWGTRKPFQVLDAPEFVDDYYLNLLDWSAHNVIVLALGEGVYTHRPNFDVDEAGETCSLRSVTTSADPNDGLF